MLDSIDKQLVVLLSQDAHQTSGKLAKKLRCSAATIRRRMRKLIRSGSLHIIGVVDPADLGNPLGAVIHLDVARNKLESVFETLEKHPEIRWLTTTTGRFDIVAIGRFSSVDGLSEYMSNRLAQVEGILDSETSICLETRNTNNGHTPPLI